MGGLRTHRLRHRRRGTRGNGGLARWCVTASAFFLLTAVPATALADVEGGCTGTVEIGGIEYGPQNDSTDNPIVVPIDEEGLSAAWQGEVSFENRDHSGSVGIVVGPWTIEIADWSGANSEDTRSATGTYGIDEFKDEFPVPSALIPRGIFELSGEHQASGGRCTGTVMVELEGSGVYAIGAAVGTVVTFLGVLAAGVARRP